MDVDVMDELMYDTLVRYFKTLAHTGYKSYDAVFKMLVMDFIYEITHTELRYYITNKDIKLMQDLLYQFLGSTCEISFPTNNRPCCVCICCNGGNSTPPPVITPTTTSTKPPIKTANLILNSTVARTAYVDYELVNIGDIIQKNVGEEVIITAQDVNGYVFSGFYVNGVLINSNSTLQYIIPSEGTNIIELKYEKEVSIISYYYGAGKAPSDIKTGNKTESKVFTFLPGMVKDFWVATPNNISVINITSNPDTIPDTNLLEKLRKTSIEVEIDNIKYNVITFTSMGNFIFPVRVTLS